VRDTQDSKGGSTDEMSIREKKELVVFLSPREKKQGIKWRDVVAISQSKNSDTELFLCKRTTGKKWRRD